MLPPVAEPFVAARQQREADLLGTYLFLATEIMLFGGIVALLVFYRLEHGADFIAASSRLNLWLGALNTAILLTSSLFVALAVGADERGAPRSIVRYLVAACVLGAAFLGVKGVEYYQDFADRIVPGTLAMDPAVTGGQQIVLSLYFVATSLHAVHLTIGIVLLATLVWRIGFRDASPARRAMPLQVAGLYWHFVDVVWIFLYPILYLARG